MSLDPISTPYLSDQASKIRAKPVPWDGYQRASLITTSELSLLKKSDRLPVDKQRDVWAKEPTVFAGLWMGLLGKLVRVDTVGSVLVLMGDMIGEDKATLEIFYSPESSSEKDVPFGPLLKVLSIQDEFIQLKSLSLLALFIRHSPTPVPSDVLTQVLSFISPLLAPSSSSGSLSAHGLPVFLPFLATLLASPPTRSLIADPASPPVLVGLAKVLKAAAGNVTERVGTPGGGAVALGGGSNNGDVQNVYWTGFCWWELSFDRDFAAVMDKKYDLLPSLLTLARTSPKQKILRIILATLANLLRLAPEVNTTALLAAGGLAFVNGLEKGGKGVRGEDEELVADLEFVRTVLKERAETLSTWDEYESELESGHLSWSPAHESEEFWKENATKLAERDGRLVRILIDILKEAKDETVLAVACADIGHYVDHHEPGKKLVNALGAKTKVMELMTHPSSDVRYRALMAVQRLISFS